MNAAAKVPGWLSAAARSGLIGQVALVVAVWVYVCALHWDNDGLWFQGDAPRHAANGLFWKEFCSRPSADPRGFALSYYARYPDIAPTAYPPVFYWLEAVAFALVGPSALAAKGLVLLFALATACYALAWLRHGLESRAGWAAALVLLLPGMVRWSHAVMLNVPAAAFGVAALYHARQALTAPPLPYSRHWYAATVFAVLTVLTHPTAGVVVFVILAWLVAGGRLRLLWNPRTLLLAALAALVVLPWAYVAVRWAPKQVSQAAVHLAGVSSLRDWTFYAGRAQQLFPWPVLVLAGCGLVGGVARRRWRTEAIRLGLAVAVPYIALSLPWAKDTRYLLVVCVPVVGLATLALLLAAEGVESVPGLNRPVRCLVFPTLLGGLLVAQVWQAPHAAVPRVSGFREIAAYMEQVAPDEAVLYDGRHDGVFTFYLQAGDPGYRRRVVPGHKLLDAYAARSGASDPDVVELLRTRSGCRWLFIEVGPHSEAHDLARRLREAVAGREFQFVRSFPITGDGVERVDLYRMLVPVQEPPGVLLAIPGRNGRVLETVQPIRR